MILSQCYYKSSCCVVVLNGDLKVGLVPMDTTYSGLRLELGAFAHKINVGYLTPVKNPCNCSCLLGFFRNHQISERLLDFCMLNYKISKDLAYVLLFLDFTKAQKSFL